jgi:hypothetical protein
VIREKDKFAWVGCCLLSSIAIGVFVNYMRGFTREFDIYLKDCEEFVPKLQRQHANIDGSLRRLEK